MELDNTRQKGVGSICLFNGKYYHHHHPHQHRHHHHHHHDLYVYWSIIMVVILLLLLFDFGQMLVNHFKVHMVSIVSEFVANGTEIPTDEQG
jgi:hypothetical protein